MIFDSTNETVTLDRAEAQAAWSALSHCLQLNIYCGSSEVFEKRIAQDMEAAFRENFVPAPRPVPEVDTRPINAMAYCAGTSEQMKVSLYDELYQVILDMSPTEYSNLQTMIGKDILETIQPTDVR